MDADGSELECRVCRSGAEDGRPLYFPCMCSGSIGAVHQDCLEAWLEHSKKDTCELCYTKYEFRPHYLEGTPEVLPVDLVTKSILKIALEQVSPLVLRIVFAVLVWAIVVPVLTTCIYCVCVGRSSILSLQFTWPVVKSHIVHGINTDALIALSLLILVSFTDFLRFHIVPVPPDQDPLMQNPVEAAGAAVPAAAPVAAVPIPEPAAVPNAVERRPVDQQGAELPPLAAALVAAAAAEARAPADQLGMSTTRRFQQAMREMDATNTQEDWDNLTNSATNEWHERADLDAPQTPAHGAYYSRRDNPQIAGATGGLTQRDGVQSGIWEGADQNLRHMHPNVGADDAYPRDSSSSGSSSCHSSASNDTVAPGPASLDDGEEFWQDRLDVEDLLHDLDAAGGRVNPVPNQDQQGIGAAAAPLAAEGGLFDNLNDVPGDLLDDPDLPPDGAEAGAGEIRLAIFELLGVEGPFHLMFRNSFWLLGFCSLYLFFSVMLPYVMGKMLCQLLFTQNALMAYVVPATVQTFVARIQHYSDSSVPMQFLDFFYVSGGFAGIFCAVFLVDCFASALLSLKKLPNYLKVVLELIGKLAMVIKVGSLLLVRIFLLPLALGTAMIALAAPLVLPYTLEDWAWFVAVHSLGAFALAWVAGITFMLTMTVTVLQLREVLHPAVFANLIRPQEPHVELIQSLIVEPGHVHVRRVFISLAVYAVLMMLFILVPLVQLVLSCRVLGVSPQFQFRHWYVVPEVQIPLELFVVHVCFLSVLDTRKDVIGRLQHGILLFLTDQLGLKMMLLPHATQADGTVGAPLRRPPPGWDLRQPNQSTRWAWGTEEPSDAERNVYPRTVPSDWLPRTVVLVLLCWAIVNALTMYLLCVPIPLARKVLSLLHYPEAFQHDPLNFAVGLTISASVVHGIYRRVPRADRWTAIWQSFLAMPVSTLQYVILLLGYLMLAYTCFGILLRAVSVPCDIRATVAAAKVALVSGSVDWSVFSARSLTGLLSNALFTGLVTAQMARSVLTNNAILAYLQQAADVEGVNNSNATDAAGVHAAKTSTAYRFVRFLEQLKVLAIDVRLALNNGTYNTRALRLREIEKQLVRPFLREVLIHGVLLAALLAMGWSLLLFGTVRSSPEVLFSGFQCATYLYAVRCVFCLVYYPLRSSQQALHRKILDDNYLVGRTLVNNAAQATRQAAQSGSVPTPEAIA